MGNNNSRQDNKDVIQKELYAKNQETQLKKLNDSVYSTANNMHDQIWDNDGDHILIERRVEIFSDPSRGISLPYITDKNAFASDGLSYRMSERHGPGMYDDYLDEHDKYDPYVSSENKRYVEFIICQGDLNDIREKFSVNKTAPNHECLGNCHCIEEIVEISGNNIKPYKKSAKYMPTTLSPTSDEPFNPYKQQQKYNPKDVIQVNKMNVEYNPKDVIQVNKMNVEYNPKDVIQMNKMNVEYNPKDVIQVNKMNVEYMPTTLSPTSDDPSNLGQNKYQGTVFRVEKLDMPTWKQDQPMAGGADMNAETSPEEITDSDDDEQRDDIFSATSEVSDTATSPVNNKKKDADKKSFDTMAMDDETSIDDEIDDDDDDDDEILEGLDDEDIEAEGFIMEQSDINSSDLYRIQRRIFASETDDEDLDDFDYSRKNMRKNSRNAINDDDDTSSTTERVRQAINQMNMRDTLFGSDDFDSEDKDIMNMNSSTDKYMKKPTRRNGKYY